MQAKGESNSKHINSQSQIMNHPRNLKLLIHQRTPELEEPPDFELSNNNLNPLSVPSSNEDFVELPLVRFFQPIPLSKSLVPKPEDSVIISRVQEEDLQKRTEPLELSENDHSQIPDNIWDFPKIRIVPSREQLFSEEEYTIPIVVRPKMDSLPVQKKMDSLAAERKRRDSVSLEGERKKRQEERRQERQRNIYKVSDFLAGKVSLMWLFALGVNTSPATLKQVKQIYSDYIDSDYEVPICNSYKQSLPFLSQQRCLFKVVTDVGLAHQFLPDTIQNRRVSAIYLYAGESPGGVMRALEIKTQSRKVKAMIMKIGSLAQQIREQIQNETRFIKVGQEDLERVNARLRFPSFIQLSGQDSSDITTYRLCLYAAIKLNGSRERAHYLAQFVELIDRRYSQNKKQMDYLREYQHLDHLSELDERRARQVLGFYVRETFYYSVLNSILRVSKIPEQFRPITVPFNETYHAIRLYYREMLKNDRRRKAFKAFRGARLRDSDVRGLIVGSYIELLGFTSSSLKRKEAERFMDNDSYLIEIQVKQRGDKEPSLYDHGFVDINRFKLASGYFEKEEEILFNALNVFRVTKLDLDGATRIISLDYGSLLDILAAPTHKLSIVDRRVLSNYRYCVQTFDAIEDDGDVFLLTQQHDKCRDFYQNKIQQGKITSSNYRKLANAQFESGDLNAAYQNALRSLTLEGVAPVPCPLQAAIARIRLFDRIQDIPHLEQSMRRAVIAVGPQDWLHKAYLYKYRAQQRFTIGNFSESLQDLYKSQYVLKEWGESFNVRRSQLERRWLLRSICCCVGSRNIEDQKQLQILALQQAEVQYQHLEEQRFSHLMELAAIKKRLSEALGSRKLYEESLDEAENYSKNLSKESSCPIAQARLFTLHATAVNRENLKDFQGMMEKAILLLSSSDPMHKDLGACYKALGNQRQAAIRRRMQLISSGKQPSDICFEDELRGTTSGHRQQRLGVEGPVLVEAHFDYEEHESLYRRCKLSLGAAAENIAYHRGSSHPECLNLQNRIGELELDFSRLGLAEKTVSEVMTRGKGHSEAAKAALILAKVSLAKGELKKSFQEVQQTINMLRSALLKVDNQIYRKVLLNNPIYLQAGLHKAKVFNRQLRHDLALKELKVVKKAAKRKIGKQLNSNLLASVYEQQAEILVCLGQTEDFEKYLLKAVEIRQQQLGHFNVPNAICYANLFKYLRYLEDFETALSYHYKAVEIFARFPSDHPNAWVIHLSNGLSFYQKKDLDSTQKQIQLALRVAARRYSDEHINLLKLQFQFGKLLNAMGKYDRSLETLQDLQSIIERCISKSNSLQIIEREIDDQKYSIRRNLYIQLKEIYIRQSNNPIYQQSIRRCDQRLSQYKLFASSDSLIDSHKSV